MYTTYNHSSVITTFQISEYNRSIVPSLKLGSKLKMPHHCSDADWTFSPTPFESLLGGTETGQRGGEEKN